MKKTLRCAMAAISAIAVAAGTALPASAANVKIIYGSNGCSSNPGNCFVNSTGCSPTQQNSDNIRSFLQDLLKKYGCCLDNTDNNVTPPADNETGNGAESGSNNNSCSGESCVTKPNTEVTKPNTGTAKPGTSETENSVSDYEKRVVELVNKERAAYGLSELTLNSKLSDVARAKSQDMKDKKYFSHTSPTYGSPFDMMKSFGITYKSAGENIAMGYRTPEAVVEGWMNSKGHRANILSSSFKEIGVGYVADGNYWTQMFIG